MGGMPGGASFHFSGMPGGSRGGAHFTNPEDIFRSFFGTSDPFQAGGGDDFPSMMGGFGGFNNMSSMGGGHHKRAKKSEPITYTLNVSLDDLYTGKLKKVRITKKIADEASGRIVEVQNDKEIHIKPGWKDGTKITFERAGDEYPGITPADIIFVIQTKPHDVYERDGDDLIYNVSAFL